jgi:hypothetical protein
MRIVLFTCNRSVIGTIYRIMKSRSQLPPAAWTLFTVLPCLCLLSACGTEPTQSEKLPTVMVDSILVHEKTVNVIFTALAPCYNHTFEKIDVQRRQDELFITMYAKPQEVCKTALRHFTENISVNVGAAGTYNLHFYAVDTWIDTTVVVPE